MGIADAIVDLVSSGTTLKENNLKEIEGGVLLESQVKFLSPTCKLFLAFEYGVLLSLIFSRLSWLLARSL